MTRAASLTALLLSALVSPLADTATEARAMRKAGQLPDAIRLLTEAHRSDPADAELAGLLGLCLMDDGRLDEAAALGTEPALQDPPVATASDALYVRELYFGRLALARQSTEEAIPRLERACEISERPVEALVNLIRAHGVDGNYVRGAAMAERLQIYNETLGRKLGGEMLEAAGDRIIQRAGHNVEAIPRALEMYEAAHQKAPDDDALTRKVYDALVRCHRPTEALELLDRLFPAAEDPAERDYQLGRCLKVAGDIDGAERAFRSTLAAAPLRTEAAVELARILVDRSDTVEAVQLLSPCAERSAFNGDVQMLLGVARLRDGDLAGAETHLRRAVYLSPHNPEGFYHLGRVLVRIGQTEEGRALLRESQKAGG